MEIGECKNRDTCEMKHPEVCYNMQYYNYCPRSDADCKFVHPKNIQNIQRKQARRQNTGNYYHNYYQNRYQELDGYDKEDFFGYSQRPWNIEIQMRGVRTPNMYPQQYQQYQHMYQHAHQHQHPYPPYPYIY